MPLYNPPTGTTAGGDLSGAYPNPTVAKSSASTFGVYGVTPVARPAAYTQTYATASRTHASPVAAAVTDTSGVAGFAAAADRTAVVTAVNNLITDLANVKQVLNSLIDDGQSIGTAQ